MLSEEVIRVFFFNLFKKKKTNSEKEKGIIGTQNKEQLAKEIRGGGVEQMPPDVAKRVAEEIVAEQEAKNKIQQMLKNG